MNADPTAVPTQDDVEPFVASMQRLDDPAAPTLAQFHPAYRDRYERLAGMLERARPLRVAVVEQLYLLQTPRPWVPAIVHAVAGRNVFGDAWQQPRRASVAEVTAGDPRVVVFAVPDADLYRTQVHIGRLQTVDEWSARLEGRRLIALDGRRALHRAGPGLMTSLELLAWALHRPNEELRPEVGAGAEMVESGWRDLAGV